MRGEKEVASEKVRRKGQRKRYQGRGKGKVLKDDAKGKVWREREQVKGNGKGAGKMYGFEGSGKVEVGIGK